MWSLRRLKISPDNARKASLPVSTLVAAFAGYTMLSHVDNEEQQEASGGKRKDFDILSDTDWEYWHPPSLLLETTRCESAFLVSPSLPGLKRQNTLQKLEEITEDIASLEDKFKVDWKAPLGEGAYGAVFRATDRETGESVAVKQIHKRFTDERSFERETDALMIIRDHGGHPHICGLRESYNQGDHFYLVLDFIGGQEVFEALCNNGPFSEADAAWHIQEAASALSFMHGIGIIHCDLKPENLMLSSKNSADAVIKVVDLGCAHLRTNQLQRPQFSTGSTPAYCPPEILLQMRKKQNPRINPSYDSWSLGVILYTMLVGVHPFDPRCNASDEEIEETVLSGKKPPLRNFAYAQHLSEDAMSLIEGLMDPDPSKRLTIEQVLTNPWVRGETASSKKIAGSDQRLALYRKYRTQIGSAFIKTLLSQTDAIHKSKTSERVSVLQEAFQTLDKDHSGYLSTREMCGTGIDDDETELSFSDVSSLLSETLKNQYFGKGRVLYDTGDTGERMYLIDSGTVQVTSRDGIQTTRTSGEIFGEEILNDSDSKYNSSVECLTPVHAIEIPRDLFAKYVSSDEETFLSMAERTRYRRRQRANTVLGLNKNCSTHHFGKNETIFRAGSKGDSLFLVANGQVDITVKGHCVRSLAAGEMTGEHAVYFNKPYNVTSRCVSESCEIQALSSSALHKLFHSDPSLRQDFHDLVLRRDFKKAICASIGKPFPSTEEDIRSAFEEIDLDKSGKVDLDELRALVQNFDSEYDDRYIQDMLDSLDLNKSGSLTWAEFLRIFSMDKES